LAWLPGRHWPYIALQTVTSPGAHKLFTVKRLW